MGKIRVRFRVQVIKLQIGLKLYLGQGEVSSIHTHDTVKRDRYIFLSLLST